MSDVLLNVATIRESSRVNGPGTRAVVWVQGCTIGCPGCFNASTHPHRPKKLLDPELLAEEVAGFPGIEGLSISGGEPFEQALGCALLAEAVQRRGLSVVVFSGYPLARLRRATDPAVARFLAAIDILVAGPYVQRLATDGKSWLGSSNQEVHFLSNRYAPDVLPAAAAKPIVELRTDGRKLVWSGFPDQRDNEWLAGLANGALPAAEAERVGERGSG